MIREDAFDLIRRQVSDPEDGPLPSGSPPRRHYPPSRSLSPSRGRVAADRSAPESPRTACGGTATSAIWNVTALERVLVEARQQLESGSLTGSDRDDAADDLGKHTEEIKKPEPQPGRVKRLFDGIKQLAPDVASILFSAAKIGALIKG